MFIEIKIAGTTEKGKLNDDFLRVPYVLKNENDQFVAPLWIQEKSKFDLKNTPVWKFLKAQFWVAYLDGKVVGRIAAMVHQDSPEDLGYFGFFASIPNQETVHGLLTVAEEWFRLHNIIRIMGPFSPTINYELGVLVSGFDLPPVFMMPYNGSFLDQYFQSAGYEKAHDFLAYNLLTNDFVLPDVYERILDRYTSQHEVGYQNLDFSQIEMESQIVCHLYNQAFQDHWAALPFHLDEVIYMAKELKSIVDPDFFFYLTVDGVKVGFILALPDINVILKDIPTGRLFPFGWYKLWRGMSKINTVRVLNVALGNKARFAGAGLLLYQELFERIRQKGMLGGELSWVSESNIRMNGALNKLGAKPTKRYRIYSKVLQKE